MRVFITIFAIFFSAQVSAQTVFSAQGTGQKQVLSIYSSLEEVLAKPLISVFQSANPNIEIHYYDLQTLEIYERVISESDANQKTADIVISSAMDLQFKLANDGYASTVRLTEPSWPSWAKWQDSVFGLTFEPSVIVYNKSKFKDKSPPLNRADLKKMLLEEENSFFGQIGTYDIERSGLGFLFLSRDSEHDREIWELVNALGSSGVRLYNSSSSILERVGDGRLALGYNILGSYAQSWSLTNPDIGIILSEDYTVVMSRMALVPAQSENPALGGRFLRFLMSEPGQKIMAEELDLPAVHPAINSANTASAFSEKYGDRLRPISIGPGLVAYLDQVKRARFVKNWNKALRGE